MSDEEIKSKYTSYDDFMEACAKDVAKSYIVYDLKTQQHILPQIITMAGVWDAIPIDPKVQTFSEFLPQGFNLTHDWAGFSDAQASRYIHQNHVNETKHMAKLNPGYNIHTLVGNLNKTLDRMMDSKLIDYLVKERMFTFYEVDGCIPGTEEHRVLEEIVNDNPWPKPIVVYGYDDTWGIEGYLFEAETKCVKERNMGQVATNNPGVSNLVFFSRENITAPLKSIPDPEIGAYNSSKTYISFVVGDGDALYEYGNMKKEMERRVKYCSEDPDSCFPLIWTMSPQLIKSSAPWIKWFYEQALKTGKDYFILPPSGDTYSYPSLMKGETAENFVTNTENDAKMLDTSGTMSWEWFLSWGHAVKEYFPRYSPNNIVRGFFAINVPYMFPIEAFSGTYKVIGGNSVLFKPLADW